jgi:transcriptional regulator with XRE-family HTH domain
MTDADRLRAMLERLRLSQRGLARALDLDERLVRRWCAGQQPVPVIVWLALEGLASRLPTAPLH